ncbi:MAG: hypothetical protein KF718_07495 [Polyangiaceae bacterium]|nr:hypothetical protein [Polyangiaceae bacterium]
MRPSHAACVGVAASLALVTGCRASTPGATAPDEPPARSVRPDAGLTPADAGPVAARAAPQHAVDPPAARKRVAEFVELAGAPGALLHPPRVAIENAPLVVFLHGMCANPHWECPVFRAAAAEAWLLCPKGPTACAGDGAMWTGTTRGLLSQLERATDALDSSDPPDLERRAIVGYSLGATAALRVALASPGRFRRMMIVGANVVPNPSQLRSAGIDRIALVAGEHDGAARGLRRGAGSLAAAGVDARFFSLGAVGHFFDASTEARLEESLSWLTADFHLRE